jgi:hypothetical protein
VRTSFSCGHSKRWFVNTNLVLGSVPGDGAAVAEFVEVISTPAGQPLVYIIRPDIFPDRTTFVTPPEFKQQVGFVVYPAGGEVPRHVHRDLERHLIGTSEVLVVAKGKCLIDVYDDQRELVATRQLITGDITLLISGGHGFRMLEDTVFLEVKQGPYTGLDEKVRF